MSGIKPVALTEFYRWLRRWANHEKVRVLGVRLASQRGVAGPMQLLSWRTGCGRAHLCQVLTGKRPGGHTWPKIILALPEDGLRKLEQCPAWNAFQTRMHEKGNT
jgi:hypothetical protein